MTSGPERSGGGATDVEAPAGGRGGAFPPWYGVVVAAVASVAGLGLARVWQLAGRDPLSWADTADFLAVAGRSWTSPDLWAGERPVGAPLALKLVGDHRDSYVCAQALLAVVCWSALVASVVAAVPGRAARVGAGLAVAAFSLTMPVTMWERSVLSESPALSLLALVAAALVQVARGPTAPRVAALLAALALWLALRDSHLVVAIAGGAVLLGACAVSAARSRRVGDADDEDVADDGDGDDDGDDGDGGDVASRAVGSWRRPLAALGVGAVVLGGLVAAGSMHGGRHEFPTRNVYAVRVLPYPDRVEWFARHGMPQADRFLGADRREPYVDPGGPPIVYVADDDRDLQPWLDWVEEHGRTTFARYVATHPPFLVTEPLRTPERAFNNAFGDREFYAAPDQVRVPLVDRVLALPTTLVLGVAAAAGGWAWASRRCPPVAVAGFALAALSVPHGLAAWHSDGMETARHLVVPAVQLHLGVLLAVVGLATAGIGRAPSST